MTMCQDAYGNYYECSTSSGLGTLWIVIIIIAGGLKVLFWTCVCYQIRRRRSRHYTIANTRMVAVVAPGNSGLPYYPANTNTRPTYVAQPLKPPSPVSPTPTLGSTCDEPPTYSQNPDREPLMP